MCFLVQAPPFDCLSVGGLEHVCEVLQGFAHRYFVHNGLSGIDWLSQAHELTVVYSRHLSDDSWRTSRVAMPSKPNLTRSLNTGFPDTSGVLSLVVGCHFFLEIDGTV